jgi:ribulose-5-phosphate 4-epimerase/fuculose-1-phosphate aldolase
MPPVISKLVAVGYRALARDGLVSGTSGSVSVADRANGVLHITGAGMAGMEANADGVAEVDIEDGRHLSGPAPSIELPLHLAAAAGGADAVTVTHGTASMRAVLTRERIAVFTADQAMAAGGAIPVVAFVADYVVLGEAAAAAMARDRVRACAIRHYGLLSTGPHLIGAMDAAYAVERSATLVGVKNAPELEPAIVAELAGRGPYALRP